MQVTTETFGDVLVAHTPDELTEDTLSVFFGTLDAAVEDGQSNIVLQMDATDFYDSAGLTRLVELHETLLEHGGNVKICGLVDVGRKVFEVTRLDQRFDIFESVIDAVGSF